MTLRSTTLATAVQAQTLSIQGTPPEFGAGLARIYQDRQGKPLWVTRPDAATEIPALIDRFADAGSHGLDPGAYPVPQLREMFLAGFGNSHTALAALDVILTDATLGYLADLTGQRNRMPLPADLITCRMAVDDLAERVGRLADGPLEPAKAIETEAPDWAEYEALRQHLWGLNKIENSGGWPVIPGGPLLRPGDSDPRVSLLRARLLGDSFSEAAPEAASETTEKQTDIYEDALSDRIHDFQRHSGLVADGIVGPRTLAAINVPVEQRQRQVEFSLERLRCLPQDLGDRYVRVDILQGRLRVMERDSVVLQMRTIVGRPERPTPVVSSRITELVTNPCWNVPQTLAREDILPKVLDDPTYLSRHDIRVFSNWVPGAPEIDPLEVNWQDIVSEDMAFKFQQRPGPKNPLGRAKFLFYNSYSVYIHDTPHSYKFSLSQRFFSSGCVRVEDPVALAQVLMDDDFDQFTAALGSSEPTKLKLSTPVNVHLVYLTAWANEKNEICFRDDVYAFDADMTEILLAETAGDTDGPFLPGANRAGIDVDKPGTGVVAHATNPLQ